MGCSGPAAVQRWSSGGSERGGCSTTEERAWALSTAAGCEVQSQEAPGVREVVGSVSRTGIAGRSSRWSNNNAWRSESVKGRSSKASKVACDPAEGNEEEKC